MLSLFHANKWLNCSDASGCNQTAHFAASLRFEWRAVKMIREADDQGQSGTGWQEVDRWLCIRGSVLRLRDKLQPGSWHWQDVMNHSLKCSSSPTPPRLQRAASISSAVMFFFFYLLSLKVGLLYVLHFVLFACPAHTSDYPDVKNKLLRTIIWNVCPLLLRLEVRGVATGKANWAGAKSPKLDGGSP